MLSIAGFDASLGKEVFSRLVGNTEIYDRYGDNAYLVAKFSEDETTKTLGGDLNYFAAE